MSRTKTHITESLTKNIFRSAIESFSSNEFQINEGGLVYREISERDYGVDGEIEVFENDEVTGKIARVQLKGKEKVIEKLKRSDYVSCPKISKSSLGYCKTNNIPFILVYISKADKRFYYCDLQPLYKNAIKEMGDQSTCTIRIPVENNSDDLTVLIQIINSYYEDQECEKNSHRKGSVVKGEDK